MSLLPTSPVARGLALAGATALTTWCVDWAGATAAEHTLQPMSVQDVRANPHHDLLRLGIVHDDHAAHGTRAPRDIPSAVVAGGLAAAVLGISLLPIGGPGIARTVRTVGAGLVLGGTLANMDNRFVHGRVMNYIVTPVNAVNLADVALGVGFLGFAGSFALAAIRR